MDKFSELITKGVAAFTYTPIANDIPNKCPICKAYNNIFGIANDTHMSRLSDSQWVITGKAIKNPKNFDSFLCSTMYGGIRFTDSGEICLSYFLSRNGLLGHYAKLNGDDVYILDLVPGVNPTDANITPSDVPTEAVKYPQESITTIHSYITNESIIPVNARFLSKNKDLNDILECNKEDIYETAKALNESKLVKCNNWTPVRLSVGVRFIGSENNSLIYIL